MESLHWNSVVHGHHMYKHIWTPFVDEILRVEQEDDNPEDCFAVCIVKGSTGGDNIVGHVPREVSHLVWYFIKLSGSVVCEITGHRKQVGPHAPISHG